MSGDHFNTRNLPADPNWQFGNQSINIQLPNSSIPSYQEIQMASSSFPQVLNHPSNPQNSAFSDNAMALPNNLPIGMFLPKNLGILPPSLSDFSPDSSFIERAAKFSSFTAGNYTALVNPFKMKDSSMSIDHGSRCESPINNQRDNVNAREETHDMANVSGDSSSKGLNAKKRKKNNQDLELDQVQEETQFSAEIPKGNVGNKQNVECSSSKSSGKNGKGSTDGAKQDYVHVRARRGQATNSHSLAERVRRERISERMKHLQDIVPGCSKVTGKAVMLDEIINYVQSLQRQVEFLSMKLATVNPSTDLNIKGLLSKDILQPQAGSTPMNFLPDLIHPQLLSSQHGLVQSGTHGIVNHSDAFRRAVNAQFAAMNGFKDPTSQISNQWEAELQNMVQMNFDTNTQEFDGKPRDGFPL